MPPHLPRAPQAFLMPSTRPGIQQINHQVEDSAEVTQSYYDLVNHFAPVERTG